MTTTEEKEALAYRLRNEGYTFFQICERMKESPLKVYSYLSINNGKRTKLTINIDGRQVVLKGLRKRKYAERCELCGGGKKKGLEYHHFSDDAPSVGVWLCWSCHRGVECIDKDPSFPRRYKALKKRILEEHIE